MFSAINPLKGRSLTRLLLASVSPSNRQHLVVGQLSRTLSATSSLASTQRNVKLEASAAGDGLAESSFMQSIAAEWEEARPFSEVPGPSQLQMIRGFMKGGEFHGMSMIDLLLACRRKYGDTYLLPGPLGQKPKLAVFDVRDFEKVHRTEGVWPVRPSMEAIEFYRQSRKDGFFKETMGLAGKGKSWSDFRTAVNPVLMKPQNARLYLHPMMRVNEQFIERIRTIRDPVTHEVPDTFFEDINCLTFESVAVVALDKQLGLLRNAGVSPEARQLFENLRLFIRLMYDLGFQPSLYRFFPTPTYRRFERAMDSIFDICVKYVQEALDRIDSAPREGVRDGRPLSVLEQLVKIDRKVAMIMAMDLMQSGVDTTSSVLSATLLLLATNPAQQAKLRAEVLAALGPDPTVDFTLEAMQRMPYLRACIKESLRIHPLIPGNMRQTGADLVLGGFRVPKGTDVLINSNLLLSEERFFPRPREFIPERWLRTESQRLIADDLNPFVYLPFGFGPRTCAGKRIVDLELELSVANLVRNFEIEFHHPTENAFVCHFMNVPAIPLRFKFTDIQTQAQAQTQSPTG